MSGPEDVLDVMHDCAERLRTKGCFAFAAELDAARATVAELIEAADKAKWGLYVGVDVAWALADLQKRGIYAPRCADGKPSRADAGKDLQTIEDAYAVFNAALARCRGEA